MVVQVLLFGVLSLGPSDLFDDDIDLIAVFHVEFFGCLGLVESLSVEEESDVVDAELR